jgi:hypothetical protein
MQIQNSINNILASVGMCISYTAVCIRLFCFCGKREDIKPHRKPSQESEVLLLNRFNNDLQEANYSYSQEIEELTKKQQQLAFEKMHLRMMIHTMFTVCMIMTSSYAIVIYVSLLLR